MDPRTILFELLSTLADACECGDLRGHLRAWWQAVRHPEPAEA
jgi:hypothetical protein